MHSILFLLCTTISACLIVLLLQVRDTRHGRVLLVGTVLITFWLGIETLCSLISVPTVAILLQTSKFVSIILVPPVYLWFAIGYRCILYWGLFRLPKTSIIPIARKLLAENLQDPAFSPMTGMYCWTSIPQQSSSCNDTTAEKAILPGGIPAPWSVRTLNN
jgi:hypothetical protein